MTRKVTQRAVRSRARSLATKAQRAARHALRRNATTALSWLGRAPVPERTRIFLAERLTRRPGPITVPIDDLLLGAQNARHFTAKQFAEQTGDLMWASTPVAAGPHAQLLRLAQARAGAELGDEEILKSSYGQMALACIQAQGRFFDAADADGVVRVARSFLRGEQRSDGAPRPVLVAPISGSRCYQVLDGHHRVARAAVRGDATVEVVVKWLPVTTPLQDLLTRMSWLDGERQLYQPLHAPELDESWPVVRRCTDRLEKMLGFLAERGLAVPQTETYLDVASCYGWFVRRMQDQGYVAEGIERDPLAPELGRAAYGLEPTLIHVGDCETLLAETDRTWDVVSCFSLLHHFVLGRGSVGHEDLLRLLDRVTGRVLFLDTGQEHEEWFRESLAGWDADSIRRTLLENTSFDEVVDLGPDLDAVPPHERNYGRRLFACVRSVQ